MLNRLKKIFKQIPLNKLMSFSDLDHIFDYLFNTKSTFKGTVDFTDADVIGLKGGNHKHTISDITNLQSELDNKQDEISGLNLSSTTVSNIDKILIQDTSDGDSLKTVTVQSILDLTDLVGGDSGLLQDGEVPNGVINSVNTNFILSYVPANPNSIIVVLNGIIQYNGIDYTVTDDIITFITPPVTGSTIYAYNGVTESLNNNVSWLIKDGEVPTGTVNSSNKDFVLSYSPVNPGSIIVVLNGVAQYNGIDYNILGDTITFITAPIIGSTIYAYSGVTGTTSGSGGAVDSVNSQTGVVILDADDIDDSLTLHKFVTANDIIILSNTSGTNTGDQDLSGKQDTLVSGTNIKTLNNISLLGSGNINTPMSYDGGTASSVYGGTNIINGGDANG
jgi:hypothetical protein